MTSGYSAIFDPLKDKSYRRTALGGDIVAFLAWKKLGMASPRTLDQYERDLARGALMFPKVSLEAWTIAELSHVSASFPDASRRTRTAAWKSFFSWAMRMDLIDRNPAHKLPVMPRNQQHKIDIFDEAEIGILCNLPIEDGALMRILFDAGLRRDEAIGLRLEAFKETPAPGELHILGKGNKGRVIPATLAVAQAVGDLAILEGLNPGDHLWYSSWQNEYGSGRKRRRRIGVGTFCRWWQRCLDLTGVRYRNPHAARHTFATRYLRHPAGRMDRLKLAMGHDSIKTTVDLYGHLDTGDLAADFAEIFRSNPDPSETP